MSLTQKVCALLAAGALAFGASGCGMKVYRDKEIGGGIYAGGAADFGLEYLRWDDIKLGKKIRTTPVHPDDASFLSGDTTTDNPRRPDSGLALRTSLEGSAGLERVRLKVGGAARFSGSSDDYREGSYDVKQQSSDTRPAADGSFVFTQFTPDTTTLIPYVGIEVIPVKNYLRVGVEYGFPYTGFEVTSGYDRYGNWQTHQSEHWSGFGQRVGATIHYSPWGEDSGTCLFLFVGKETYKPTFAGEKAEIGTLSGSVFLGFKWIF
jgi:hypothetical protein